MDMRNKLYEEAAKSNNQTKLIECKMDRNKTNRVIYCAIRY